MQITPDTHALMVAQVYNGLVVSAGYRRDRNAVSTEDAIRVVEVMLRKMGCSSPIPALPEAVRAIGVYGRPFFLPVVKAGNRAPATELRRAANFPASCQDVVPEVDEVDETLPENEDDVPEFGVGIPEDEDAVPEGIGGWTPRSDPGRDGVRWVAENMDPSGPRDDHGQG